MDHLAVYRAKGKDSADTLDNVLSMLDQVQKDELITYVRSLLSDVRSITAGSGSQPVVEAYTQQIEQFLVETWG